MTAEEEALFGIDKLNVVRSEIPAVTHVDYSARIQTVHAETNPRFHALLSAFKQRTGCPVLVNTSFNVRGEPIVGSPEDAYRCFMGTELDLLVIGNCILEKDAQEGGTTVRRYEAQFALD
jgi:carbamoyltransferase